MRATVWRIPVLCLAVASLGYLLPSGTSRAVGSPRAAPPTVVIRVNQVGFRPDDSKRGLVMATGVIQTTTFAVVDASGGVVLSGPLGARLPAQWSPAYPDVYPVDFSWLRTPGSYRLRIVGADFYVSPRGRGDQCCRQRPGRDRDERRTEARPSFVMHR